MEEITELKLPKEFEICLQDFSDIQSEGIVDIIPINPNKFEEVTFSQFKPANQSTTFGIPRDVYMDKNGQKRVRFKRIKITGYTTYDCTIRDQAIEYHVVRNHPVMKGSPFQREKPLLKIYNREKEASQGYETILESLDALKIAANMGEEELTDFSRNLGFSPESQTYKVLRFGVAEKAQKLPAEFMEAYKHTNRGILTVIKRSEGVGLLSHDPEKGYLWKKGFKLGHTASAVVLTLQKDRELLSTMDYESKERSKFDYMKEKISAVSNENPELSKEALEEKKSVAKENVMNTADFAVAAGTDQFADMRKRLVTKAKELGVEHAGVKSTKTLEKEITNIENSRNK